MQLPEATEITPSAIKMQAISTLQIFQSSQHYLELQQGMYLT